MAQVTIAQAPVPVWEVSYSYPIVSLALGAGQGMNPNFYYLNGGLLQVGANPYDPNASSSGGGGITSDYFLHRGLLAARYGTTGAIFVEGTFFPWWAPTWGPAGGISPGAVQSAVSSVAVLDYLLATNGITNIGTGVILLPWSGADIPSAAQPQEAAPTGGFGIVGDGAGNMQFVTWESGTGAVLSNTPIPAGVVPDFEDWNLYRIIIVTGDSANPATLTLEVNGTLLVDRLAFGSATLERPDQGLAQAYTFASIWAGRQPGGAQMFGRLHGRWGRTLPSGVAIQGE